MKLKPIAKKHPCKSYSILSELCSFISLIYAAIEWHIITNVSIYEFFLFVYLKPPSPPPSLPLSLYNLLTLQHISHQFVCKWYQRFFPHVHTPPLRVHEWWWEIGFFIVIVVLLEKNPVSIWKFAVQHRLVLLRQI